MTRFQIFAFSVLHTLGVLLLPLLITLLGGCLEIEELQTPPPAACEDVEFALNDASTFQPNSLTVNDFVATQETVAPLANTPQVTADVIEKLISVDPKPQNIFEIHKLQTTITYNDGQSHEDTKEAVSIVPVPYTLCPAGDGVSYHGLQVFHRKMKVTEYKDSCGSFANCEVNIAEVKFDQIFHLDDGRQEVRKFDLVMSKEVPYLAKTLKFCISGTIDVNGQSIPVTQCSNVKNFGNSP